MAVAGFGGSVAALAQTTPVPPQITPGGIGNQLDRQQQQFERQQGSPQTAPQDSAVTGPASSDIPTSGMAPGTTFTLTAINFDPSTLLGQSELSDLAHPYIGKKVGFDDLWSLVQKVNALYKSKGQVTARAILPLQSIHDGVVRIQLIEGKLGKIEIKGANRITETFVNGRIVIDPGTVVDVNTLTQKVVYFNRTNDVQVRALLKPGIDVGQTDVELGVTEPASDTFQIFADNYGVDSTGRWEGGVYYRHNNLFRTDDRLTLYGTYSHGGIDGSIAFGLPITTDGTRFNISYERNHIDILEGPFQSLGITGYGQSGSAGFSQPFLATEHWLLTGTASGSIGTSTTLEPAGVVTDTRTYRGIAGLSATYIEPTLQASFAPSFNYARSHNAVLASDRNVEIVSGTASMLARLPQDWSIRVAAAGQYTWDKLLPADLLFQVGGATSVRGYSAGAYAGDSGFYTNFEIHHAFYDVASGFDMYVAYDTGMVFSTSPSQRFIHSIAAGAEFDSYTGVALSAGVAIPLKLIEADQDDYRPYVQLSARL